MLRRHPNRSSNTVWSVAFAAGLLVGLPMAHADLGEARKLIRSGNGAIAFLEGRERAGDAEASELIGEIYYNGIGGIPVDRVHACDQFQRITEPDRGLKGAKAGEVDAQTDVARYYLFGQHFLQDYEQAARWLQAASDKD